MMKRRNSLESAKGVLREWFPDGAPVLAAVSGGIDSMCLLHLLHTWGTPHGFRVTAAHFNHGLRGETALRDQEFVREYCQRHQIPFLSGSGDTRAMAAAEGKSLEEAGRLLRYQFLRRAAEQEGCRWILTAHHADDNAETMLLNLIRGTGSAGLCGIPARRDNLCRPFLGVTRGELLEYAAENQISYVEDETNDAEEASRNVIRHRILPVLRELNPRAVENMTRTAALLTAENRLMEELAGRAAASAEKTQRGVRISCQALNRLPEPLRGRVVLDLMERVCGQRRDLTQRHASAVLKLTGGAKDGQISLPCGMLALRAGGTLEIERAGRPPEEAALPPNVPVQFGKWTVWLDGKNSAAPRNAEGILIDRRILDQTVRVTRWRTSDRLKLPGGRGARSLKRLCADRGISPLQREELPVARIGEKPIAVPGIGVDEAFAPPARGCAVQMVFQYRNLREQEIEE